MPNKHDHSPKNSQTGHPQSQHSDHAHGQEHAHEHTRSHAHGHEHAHGQEHAHEHPNQSHHRQHNHHPHHHHQHYDPHQSSSALLYAFVLNFGFCIFEAIGGAYASSQAVMADALHDFGDSLSLLLLIGLKWMATRPAAEGYSFGYRRLNVIGAAAVGLSLIVGSIIILGHSLPLLLHPEPVNGGLMLVLAVFGILVNGAAFWRLRRSGGVGETLVTLHLLEDLWGWVIVFIGAIAIKTLSWYWLDPLLSVFLAFFILWRTFAQVQRLGRLFLLGSNLEFSMDRVRQIVGSVDGVTDIHHLHVWELDEGIHIVTAHIVMEEGGDPVLIKQQVRQRLFELGKCEVTLEFESAGEKCLDPEHRTEFYGLG